MRVHSIAAPSCLVRGTVADNARLLARTLAGQVSEVGLCFFEAQSCLAYTEADLPPDLATLPLQWHVHLPVDLPWHQGGAAAAALALALMDTITWLAPRMAVLHPPDGRPEAKGALLYDFARAWRMSCDVPVLLENICANPLTDLPPESIALYNICLDVGHMLGYAQYDLPRRADLMSRVTLLHWSAPGAAGAGDQHLPLTAFTKAQVHAATQALARVPANATHMIEVFSLSGVQASIPVLAHILGASWPQ